MEPADRFGTVEKETKISIFCDETAKNQGREV